MLDSRPAAARVRDEIDQIVQRLRHVDRSSRAGISVPVAMLDAITTDIGDLNDRLPDLLRRSTASELSRELDGVRFAILDAQRITETVAERVVHATAIADRRPTADPAER